MIRTRPILKRQLFELTIYGSLCILSADKPFRLPNHTTPQCTITHQILTGMLCMSPTWGFQHFEMKIYRHCIMLKLSAAAQSS